ncbi:MAG: hypothetical protein HQ567_19295 [Candidatus Nealsonbacteria bacterium]|nr:hypothetical protein [Candidatus Nealsonbacteria bacterium]
MNRVLRESARLVVAAVLIVSIGSVGTVFADGDQIEVSGQAAAESPLVLFGSTTVTAADPSPQANWLGDAAMPKEMELLSDIVTELLSGNVMKLLADNATQLLSGNAPELFSGNEAELLSGNDTRLLSGNKPELLSGNKVQLFSNINLNISIAESGNNNTAPPPTVARQPMLLQQKKPARPGAAHGHGTVQPQNHSTTKSAKKARRAKRRFEAMDTNGDGQLSFGELQGHGTTDHAMAASERR